jgi:hypothetical protein
MKCPLCDQRKGKRFCPAQRGTICAQCCGEKRMIELNCPESCEFLKMARSREAGQEHKRFFRQADESVRQKYLRVLSRFQEPVSYLELLIAGERRGSRHLSDKDLTDALELIIATLKTEDSGLLYERASASLRVESLRRRLSEAVNFLRHPQEADQERLLLKDAIDCLDLIRVFAASHFGGPAGPQRYVDFLARNTPRLPASTGSESRIIIPGA